MVSRKMAITIGLVCATSVAALLGIRFGAFGSRAEPDLVKRLIREGRAAYAKMKMAPLPAAQATVEDVAALLSPLDARGTPPPGSGSPQSLRTAVAQFVYFRFVQTSVTEYKDWRRSGKHTLRTVEDMERSWGIKGDYAGMFKEEFPAAAPLEEVFDRFWNAGLEPHGGANRPIAVAAEPAGLTAVFGVRRRPGEERPYVEGQMPRELWHGAVAGTLRRWWTPPRSVEWLLKNVGPVPCAEVGLIVEFADHSRRPLILSYFWDAVGKTWTLENVNTNNCDTNKVTALEY
jgi:hypothetical protein